MSGDNVDRWKSVQRNEFMPQSGLPYGHACRAKRRPVAGFLWQVHSPGPEAPDQVSFDGDL